MNNVTLKGILTDIEPSHSVGDVQFNKAKLIVNRKDGKEDLINLKFKSFSNKYKENDQVSLTGNLRSYSYKVAEGKNKVEIYVFTYFDIPEGSDEIVNSVEIDGRICKVEPLRKTKNGKHNIYFILANNIFLQNDTKRLNSYIPCIAWGSLAKELSRYDVNTQLKIKGSIHSREHKKLQEDGSMIIRVAHELLVESFEVVE